MVVDQDPRSVCDGPVDTKWHVWHLIIDHDRGAALELRRAEERRAFIVVPEQCDVAALEQRLASRRQRPLAGCSNLDETVDYRQVGSTQHGPSNVSEARRNSPEAPTPIKQLSSVPTLIDGHPAQAVDGYSLPISAAANERNPSSSAVKLALDPHVKTIGSARL